MPLTVSRASVRVATAVACLLVTAAPCSAESYVIDKKHTEVRFAYRMGLGIQRGRFTSVDGRVEFEETAPNKTMVAATIATASITTGDPLVDETLKGSDFFNVGQAPRLVFASRSVRGKGPRAAEMLGDITINGVTKPVTLEVTIQPAVEYGQASREFIARTRISRSAFNMTAYELMVGDDVDIEIDAILQARAKGQPN